MAYEVVSLVLFQGSFWIAKGTLVLYFLFKGLFPRHLQCLLQIGDTIETILIKICLSTHCHTLGNVLEFQYISGVSSDSNHLMSCCFLLAVFLGLCSRF